MFFKAGQETDWRSSSLAQWVKTVFFFLITAVLFMGCCGEGIFSSMTGVAEDEGLRVERR